MCFCWHFTATATKVTAVACVVPYHCFMEVHRFSDGIVGNIVGFEIVKTIFGVLTRRAA